MLFLSLVKTFLNIKILLSKRIWNNQHTFIKNWSAKQSSIVNITEDGFKRHLKRLEDFRLSFKDHFCTNFYRVGLSQPTSQTLSDKKNASLLGWTSAADISPDGDNKKILNTEVALERVHLLISFSLNNTFMIITWH